MSETAIVTAAARRREDPLLLRGNGTYVADVRLPGMWHVAVLRSPHACARIRRIVADGLPCDAVCLTARDLDVNAGIPVRACGTPALDAWLQPLLAIDEVRYVGQPLALVVAPSRYAAEDARDRIRVEYEVLPARVDTMAGTVVDTVRRSRGDASPWFDAAATVVMARFRTNRHSGVPLETRGLTAVWDGCKLTVHGPTKVLYFNRALLSEMLGLPETRIRFATAHVGGGFGVRGEPYPEDLLVPWLAKRLGRPIQWIEDRQEHLRSINHSREMICDAALALDTSGTLLGLRAEIWYDGGAYARPHGMLLPEYTAVGLPGPYRYQALDLTAHLVLTNKTPAGTFRGPGSYESCFIRERLIDLAARRLRVDPAELRLRNLLSPADLPYDTGLIAQGQPLIYEPCDYPAHLREVLETVDYRSARRRPGVGVGLGLFVEKSADANWEYARVQVDTSGRVGVQAGSCNVGQGLETVLAQICGATLGVGYEEVDVVHSDTDRVRCGWGTYGSRSTVLAGNAVRQAALEVREKALALAGRQIEARAEDLYLEAGAVRVRGAPGQGVALAEVARYAEASGTGLVAEAVYRNPAFAVSFGCHAAVVEVDRASGAVSILRYVAAHDAGRAINPLTVRGQLHGGVGQGLGGTLLEELRYDAQGQLLTGTLADYLLPTATEVPRVETLIWEDASPGNPLGVKGVGEAGVPGVPAALSNAVAAAVGEQDEALVTCLPLTPERVVDAARRARPADASRARGDPEDAGFPRGGDDAGGAARKRLAGGAQGSGVGGRGPRQVRRRDVDGRSRAPAGRLQDAPWRDGRWPAARSRATKRRR